MPLTPAPLTPADSRPGRLHGAAGIGCSAAGEPSDSARASSLRRVADAGGPRRRPRPAPRRADPAARGARLRGGGGRRQRRRRSTGRCASTSTDVAVVDVRLPPTFTDEGLRVGDRGARGRARASRPGAVAVRRAALRARAARERRGRGRLPAQGPGVRRRRVRRRRAPGGGRRHGPRPRGRVDAAGAPAHGRPARAADRPRARGARR